MSGGPTGDEIIQTFFKWVKWEVCRKMWKPRYETWSIWTLCGQSRYCTEEFWQDCQILPHGWRYGGKDRPTTFTRLSWEIWVFRKVCEPYPIDGDLWESSTITWKIQKSKIYKKVYTILTDGTKTQTDGKTNRQTPQLLVWIGLGAWYLYVFATLPYLCKNEIEAHPKSESVTLYPKKREKPCHL